MAKRAKRETPVPLVTVEPECGLDIQLSPKLHDEPETICRLARPRGEKPNSCPTHRDIRPRDLLHSHAMKLTRVADALTSGLKQLRFGPPVTHVYNPLEYARAPHMEYLKRFGSSPRRVVLLGMNPGPWGMVQTGVPFGEVKVVRGWLGIEAPVGKPKCEHPKRPVQGFACRRSEVSGARLWGWARDTFRTPERFFARFFVANYCPLAFYDKGGRNITPDKLPAAQREPLFAACDRALRRTTEILQPRYVIGVGNFAQQRARIALDGVDVAIGRILHPSPASPAANRGWAEQITQQLASYGIRLPTRSGEW